MIRADALGKKCVGWPALIAKTHANFVLLFKRSVFETVLCESSIYPTSTFAIIFPALRPTRSD
jgi:hypothetical protein